MDRARRSVRPEGGRYVPDVHHDHVTLGAVFAVAIRMDVKRRRMGDTKPSGEMSRSTRASHACKAERRAASPASDSDWVCPITLARDSREQHPAHRGAFRPAVIRTGPTSAVKPAIR